jgi:phenylalanyl-tRNA synthetase alpha chain
MRLPETEYLVLDALNRLERPAPLDAVVSQSGLDQSKVMAAAVSLAEQGFISVKETPGTVVSLSERGRAYALDLFPERRALERIQKAGGKVKIGALEHLLTIPDTDTRRIVKWLTQKGWCKKENDSLTVTAVGQKASTEKGQDEMLVDTLLRTGSADTETLRRDGVDTDAALKLLKGRSGVVKAKSRTFRSLDLTKKALSRIAEGIEPLKEASVLTYEMLATGKWRDVHFKTYDVDLPTATVYPGKRHPLRRIIEEARAAFLTMGFTEINSPYVEMSFWVFDALYQPQDHPAREMQDTFYMSSPRESELPKKDFVDAVKATHEDGGSTGSTGWKYVWDPGLARTNVLRTHTTATTIRYLAAHPHPPAKVFNIGRVFRREKTTYKHLVEFYQVDGIVIDEKANLSTLLGSLAQFYKKMGFPKISFRPSFFPYTEPSVEAFGWLESKKAWIELGGAGIFRAEVTKPFKCEVPVLAWGLSIERVAMMRFGLSDIRRLYWSDLDWLREAELCR